MILTICNCVISIALFYKIHRLKLKLQQYQSTNDKKVTFIDSYLSKMIPAITENFKRVDDNFDEMKVIINDKMDKPMLMDGKQPISFIVGKC